MGNTPTVDMDYVQSLTGKGREPNNVEKLAFAFKETEESDTFLTLSNICCLDWTQNGPIHLQLTFDCDFYHPQTLPELKNKLNQEPKIRYRNSLRRYLNEKYLNFNKNYWIRNQNLLELRYQSLLELKLLKLEQKLHEQKLLELRYQKLHKQDLFRQKRFGQARVESERKLLKKEHEKDIFELELFEQELFEQKRIEEQEILEQKLLELEPLKLDQDQFEQKLLEQKQKLLARQVGLPTQVRSLPLSNTFFLNKLHSVGIVCYNYCHYLGFYNNSILRGLYM